MARARLFLSYGRRDAEQLAHRLRRDLEAAGYAVWIDTNEIRAGRTWEEQIRNGLRESELVIALLSPHAVRAQRDGAEADGVCLDEISYARFSHPQKVLPLMAVECEPPLCLYRLHYVDFSGTTGNGTRYREKLDEVLRRLPDALEGRFEDRRWISILKPDEFAGILSEKRRDFIGREWLIGAIMDWARNLDEPALILTGDPGIGKSAVVAHLVHRNPEDRVVAYHFCDAATPQTLQPARFVRTLAAMLAARLPAYETMLSEPKLERLFADASSDPGSAFQEGILDPLHVMPAPAGGRRLVLVDALDESISGNRASTAVTIADLLSQRISRFPTWLCLLATSRLDRGVLDRFGPIRHIALAAGDARHHADLTTYVGRRLREPQLEKRIRDAGQAPSDVATLLLQKSEGNFQYAVLVLDALARDRFGSSDLDALPPGLANVYQRWFERQFPDDETYRPAAAILAVILASREPLDDSALTAACGLPAPDFHRTIGTLESILPSAEGCPRLFHSTCAEWLLDPAATHRFLVDVLEGHRRLAIVGWAELINDVLSAYARSHLAYHLAAARRWTDLLQLLGDDRLDLFHRWIEEGHLGEGEFCLNGLIGFVRHSAAHASVLPALASQLARIHNRMDRPEEAERWLRMALDHDRRPDIVRAIALHELGSSYLARQDAARAMQHYRKALSIARRVGRGDEVAANLIALATAQLRIAPRYRRVARWATAAHSLARRHDDLPHELEACRLLADVAKSRLDFDGAAAWINDGLDKAAGLPFARVSLLLSNAWKSYLLAALDRGPVAEAERCFGEVLELATTIGDRRYAADAWSGLGTSALLRGDESRVEQAIESLHPAPGGRVPAHIAVRGALLTACLAHRRGQRSDARERFEAVSLQARAASLWAREVTALIGLGATLWHDARVGEAKHAWRTADKLAKQRSRASRALASIGIRACRSDIRATPR